MKAPLGHRVRRFTYLMGEFFKPASPSNQTIKDCPHTSNNPSTSIWLRTRTDTAHRGRQIRQQLPVCFQFDENLLIERDVLALKPPVNELPGDRKRGGNARLRVVFLQELLAIHCSKRK